MLSRLLRLFCLLVLVGVCSAQEVPVTGQFVSGTTTNVVSTGSIAGQNVHVNSGATLNLRAATGIRLKSGVQVDRGGVLIGKSDLPVWPWDRNLPVPSNFTGTTIDYYSLKFSWKEPLNTSPIIGYRVYAVDWLTFQKKLVATVAKGITTAAVFTTRLDCLRLYTVRSYSAAAESESAPFFTFDSNSNGMPDQWEVQYFHTLSRNGTSSFDSDGVTDQNEYLNGTDPTENGANRTEFGYDAMGRLRTVYGNALVNKYEIDAEGNILSAK